MHISPLRKNIPLTVVTLAALGIMLFLFFMHPSTPEESLEFYTPDGNGVGSFRVEITDMPSNPAYTEVKIIRRTWSPSSGSCPNSATSPSRPKSPPTAAI